MLYEILRALGQRSDMRVWRNNSGVAFSKNRAVRFGVPGQGDISGIRAGGQRIEIEVKSSIGRQSPQQRAFQAMIERFGGLYIVARRVEDVINALS